MSTVSTRIPKELEEELNDFMEEEHLDKSVALRKLINEGLEEWRKGKALKMLEEGEISFFKAAELSGLDPWEFARLVKDEKITWVKDEHIREDIGEI